VIRVRSLQIAALVFAVFNSAWAQNRGVYPLGMSAIILKAGAIGAAANHVEPIASQAILKFTTTGANIFKQNASVGSSSANPIQFSSPIGHPIYETSKRVVA